MSDVTDAIDVALCDLREMNESRRPSTGIWYYVYLKPKWVLMTFPVQYGNLSHYEAWMKYIVPKLIDHYDIEDGIDELEDAYRSVPRGRIDVTSDLVLGGRSPDDRVFALHGDDFPSGKMKSSELGKIYSAFNLSGLAARGLVVDKVVEHETMEPEHVSVLQGIIGEVPY